MRYLKRPGVHFIYLVCSALLTDVAAGRIDLRWVVLPALVAAGLRTIEEFTGSFPAVWRPAVHVIYGLLGAFSTNLATGAVGVPMQAAVAAVLAGVLRWVETTGAARS